MTKESALQNIKGLTMESGVKQQIKSKLVTILPYYFEGEANKLELLERHEIIVLYIPLLAILKFNQPTIHRVSVYIVCFSMNGNCLVFEGIEISWPSAVVVPHSLGLLNHLDNLKV